MLDLGDFLRAAREGDGGLDGVSFWSDGSGDEVQFGGREGEGIGEEVDDS